MLRNYLLIALRNLRRSVTYSFINITGLAIGIASSLLIMLWVWDELTFDKFHANKNQLGQLYFNNHFSDNVGTSNAVPLGPYEFLKTFDSRIKNTCIAYWQSNSLLANGEKKVYQIGRMVSPEFLEMFKFPLLKGYAATVLDDPRSIVITEDLAKALFADVDPINQTITLDNTNELKVTGVLKELPTNSTFNFQYLASWAIYGEMDWAKNDRDNWDNESYPVFIELQEGASFDELNTAIKDLPMSKIKDPSFKIEMFALPLDQWHLYSDFENGVQIGGLIQFVKYFSAIAILVLIIACINFMNLATARSERRAREVGVRKTLGSVRKSLIGQFIGESILIAALAFLIAVVVVELLLPFYNLLVEKKLFIDYASPWVWIGGLLIIVITGVLAGSYPAFYLSSFNPVQVLKGKLQASRGSATPRQVLVVSQFFFSITLLFATIVIYKQIGFVRERATGYNKANLINVQGNDEMSEKYDAIKQELLNSRTAVSVTSSSSPITAIYGNNTFDWPGKPEGQTILFSRVGIGYDYFSTMDVAILEGREFSPDFKSDSSAMIINKAALEVMGVEKPIGLEVSMWSRKWNIVGVVDDLVMESPFAPVRPGFYILDNGYRNYVTIRLDNSGSTKDQLAKTETVFKNLNPSYPFVYEFVDQEFEVKYKAISLISTLAATFAILALFITGLGLVGLATFTAEQRTKEIGIRKVMGASTNSIVQLLSRDFTKLVIIAFALSAPFSWWAMNKYLEQYDYRTGVDWWILPLTGVLILAITLIIVSTQAWKAATANPVNSLRSE
jgi:putative ABC transport system permease protein